MKKIAIILLLAVCLPASAPAQTNGTAEPSAQGKTISFWLNQYSANANSPLRREAERAICDCGTNALPWLLNQLLTTNSPLELKEINSLSSQSDDPAGKRHWRAIRCFWILGSIAKPAIESLTNMICYGKTPLVSAYALASIGTDSALALTNLMTHSDKNVRNNAVLAIDYYGYQSKRGGFAVPALVQALSDDSSTVRFHAAMALCVICEHPELAVPALKKSLKDEDKGVRLYSVRALGRYREKSAVPDIVSMLNDSDADVRESASYWLGMMTNHNETVVPAPIK